MTNETPDKDSAGREHAAPLGFGTRARLSYGEYLKVPELLALQVPLSRPTHHDELQFIIVHQTYELWFRLVLFELEAARKDLFDCRLDEATATLGRVHAIERVLVQQVHVLETMEPGAFLGFRDELRPASGFQSAQFREVELLSGLRQPRYLELLARQAPEHVQEAVKRRLAEPSLRDAMHAMLEARGFPVGYDASTHAWDDASLDRALAGIYSSLAPRDVYRALEALIQHDELFRLWRHHHVLMVERMIGTKPGTGGSSGAEYLRSTTDHQFYPELWHVRGSLGEAGY